MYAQFEADLEELRQRFRIPAVSAAIVKDQEVVWAKGFGYADIENEIPATETTAYEIASLTKPFAAAIIMQLVEADQLDLDAPIANILQDTVFTFPPPADMPIDGYAQLCTLLIELSEATSGPFAPFAFLFQEYHCDSEPIKVRHHLTHTSQGTPGETYRYNGFLYGLLSWVTEAVTDAGFEELLVSNIVEPLFMNDTVPNASASRREQILIEMAKPYQIDDAGHIVLADYQAEGRANAAAGMISTVLDLAKFDAAMDRDQLVSAESKAAMFTQTLSSQGETLPYGIGWFVQEHEGVKLIWHYGWEPDAYSSLILKVPEKEWTLILLANSDGASAPFDLGAGDVLRSPFATTFLDLFIGEETDSDLAGRIRRVEDGLLSITEEGQIRRGEPYTLSERMAHYHVPGVSIAVIEDFQIEWAKGYGALEAGGDEPVTPNTLFHAGSIAKPVSAAAALSLVGRGLLDLDGNVNGRLVSWQVPENEHTQEEKVTLRRLLSHSAGLQDGFTNRSSSDTMPGYLAPGGKAPTVTIQQLLDAEPEVDSDEPTRVTMVPGTEFRYANADYAILELLMGDATQKTFADFMGETILEPLGMTSSTFAQPLPENLRARATTEHDVNGQPLEGERLHFPFLAAGGLWTTPSDLARFALEIVRAYQGQSDQVLSQEMANEMLSPQIAVQGNPLSDSYGLGLELEGEGDSFRFVHTGGTWGSTCLLWVYPETGQGAVVMTNSASASGLIRFEILLSIAAEYGWPLTE